MAWRKRPSTWRRWGKRRPEENGEPLKNSGEPHSVSLNRNTLELQEPGFESQSSGGGKASQASIATDHPMAGNRQRPAVLSVRPSHSAQGFGISNLLGQPAVGPHFSEWNC